jgi:quercetin dioxygenase-like cupin family protein
MAMNDYALLVDLAKKVQPPDKDILSRTLYNDDRLKTVIFGFDQGEELSEHTAAKPAMLFFVKGEATVGYWLGNRMVSSNEQTLIPRSE